MGESKSESGFQSGLGLKRCGLGLGLHLGGLGLKCCGFGLWSHGLGLHPGGPGLTLSPGESGENIQNVYMKKKKKCIITTTMCVCVQSLGFQNMTK